MLTGKEQVQLRSKFQPGNRGRAKLGRGGCNNGYKNSTGYSRYGNNNTNTKGNTGKCATGDNSDNKLRTGQHGNEKAPQTYTLSCD